MVSLTNWKKMDRTNNRSAKQPQIPANLKILFFLCAMVLGMIASSSSNEHAWFHMLQDVETEHRLEMPRDEEPPEIYATVPVYRPQPRKPTTHRACEGYDGILHIQSGDVGGAAGTIFFQFVIAQLMYAEQFNLIPFVHLNNISHWVYDDVVHGQGPGLNFTALQGKEVTYFRDERHPVAQYPGEPELPPGTVLTPHHYHLAGDGVWEHYFQPVSDFVPGDASCEALPYMTMDLWLITPGLHIYAPWAPRIWRYLLLPQHIQKPHIPLRSWLEDQRLTAHKYTKKYIHLQPHLQRRADRLVSKKQDCLGMHVRWSDKEGGRRKLSVHEFRPYVEAYIEYGGRCVFVATDSDKVLQHINKYWPKQVTSKLVSQSSIVRSDDETPVFTLESHHRTNTEILIDIAALSNCRFMLHGLSAVSDSAMYLNYDLIYQSVDLEDDRRMSSKQFGNLVYNVLARHVTSETWARIKPIPWWLQADLKPANAQPTHRACYNVGPKQEYAGILQIASADSAAAAGMTFFMYILNQLFYADKYKLKPWIHLHEDNQHVYDPLVHEVKPAIAFQMMEGMVAFNERGNLNHAIYPGKPILYNELEPRDYSLRTDGIWGHYFEPVSDFRPGDKSCKSKPLVKLEYNQVVPGIYTWAPWAVRSWHYDELPPYLLPKQNQTELQWKEPMRRKANELIRKYYRFKPHMMERANDVNPTNSSICLALHIRQGDKRGGYRRQVNLVGYLKYLRAYYKGGGEDVYLATDSAWVVSDVAERAPEKMRSKIHFQGRQVARSPERGYPAFHMDDHHRTNSEALVDVLAMSKCQIIVHDSNTISEAAIYLNLDLHNASVNVEDPDRIPTNQFTGLVRKMKKELENKK